MMTDHNGVLNNKVVKGFEKLLQNETTFDPTLNGYLISFLWSMEALDQASLAIQDAFDQSRVDPDLITPEDLEEDDFEDDSELDRISTAGKLPPSPRRLILSHPDVFAKVHQQRQA